MFTIKQPIKLLIKDEVKVMCGYGNLQSWQFEHSKEAVGNELAWHPDEASPDKRNSRVKMQGGKKKQPLVQLMLI